MNKEVSNMNLAIVLLCLSFLVSSVTSEYLWDGKEWVWQGDAPQQSEGSGSHPDDDDFEDGSGYEMTSGIKLFPKNSVFTKFPISQNSKISRKTLQKYKLTELKKLHFLQNQLISLKIGQLNHHRNLASKT